MRLKWKVINVIWIFLIVITLPGYVMASGGEEMEGSRLEQFERSLSEQEKGEESTLFTDFEEMDYCLFLETNVGYEISLNYFEYGVYGDFIRTSQEGKNIYFKLNEQMIKSQFHPITQSEWADNMVNEHLSDISPDLKWAVTRQYNCSAGSKYTEKLYQDNVQVDTQNGNLGSNIGNHMFQKDIDTECYELMPDHGMDQLEKLIQKIWKKNPSYYCNALYSFDAYGKILAIAENDNQSIGIYRTEDFKLLYRIMVSDVDDTWPLEISQIIGSEENGIVLLSNGGNTYQISYPDGNAVKLGEFMFSTSYSPDMKYRAYCTGNIILFDRRDFLEESDLPLYGEMRKQWDEIPPGWYVEELETGKKTYIPVETWKWDVDRPLYGGRCVWIHKDKLLQILNS